MNDESIRTLTVETELDFEVEVEKPLSQSNILTIRTIVVVPPPGEFRNQKCAQNEMATCTTYCPSILEQMEKGIFPEFTTCREKTDMEKDNTKPCSYCYCFAET